MSDARADELKLAWRTAHPRTVAFWSQLEDAAIEAVRNPGKLIPYGLLAFCRSGPYLTMALPSGRKLYYARPKIMTLPARDPKTGKTWEATTLTYFTKPAPGRQKVDDPANTSKWTRVKGYGGAWAENAVSGMARDILAEAMLRLEQAGFPVVLSIHDEIVCEVPRGRDLKEFRRLMEMNPPWARDLPIAVEAWAGDRYEKR